MRTSRIFSVLVASTALVGGMAFITPALSQTGNPEISYERTDLSLHQVLVKLNATGYDKIDKIERERNSYEVRAIDKNGARVKLYVDPQTGEVLNSGRQGSKDARRSAENASL